MLRGEINEKSFGSLGFGLVHGNRIKINNKIVGSVSINHIGVILGHSDFNREGYREEYNL